MSINTDTAVVPPRGPSSGEAGSVGDWAGARARINRVSIAVLIALGLAFALAVQSAAGLSPTSGASSDDARLGGDFPAFYAAGSIVLDRDFDNLYDPARQQAEQENLGLDGYLAFAYPPHVAVAYAPLAALGFTAAYAIHTILMIAALLGALAVLRKPVPLIAEYWLPIVAATFAFYPLFRAVGGGQNTALTVLAFAVVWRGLFEDQEMVAGVAAGLLLYRPQYAIPLICLFVVSRNVQAAVSAIVVGLATWAVTAMFMGQDWLLKWLDQVTPFVETDAEVNAKNSISLIGFTQAVMGHDNIVAIGIGLVGGVLVAGLLAWFWRDDEHFNLPQRMAAVAVGVLLISPHTMFYDAGLLLIAGIGWVAWRTQPYSAHLGSLHVKVLAVGWLAVLVHPLFVTFSPATPLAIVVLGTFALLGAGLIRTRNETMRGLRNA